MGRNNFRVSVAPVVRIVGDGWGGWRSGIDGVKYSGLYPKSEYDLEWNGYRFRG